jgi:hypothetical protein
MSTIAPPRPRNRGNGQSNSRRRSTPERLGSYTDACGAQRDVVCLAGAAGTRLVVDLTSDGLADARLVAHLAADEPHENARTVCAIYLAAAQRPRGRRLTPADFQVAFGEGASPTASDVAHDAEAGSDASPTDELVDRRGCAYRLEPVPGSLSIPELRWCRYVPGCQSGQPATVSLRDVIGALQSYEPALKLTLSALKRHEDDSEVSVALLRAEHERAIASPIVLNRGLREAVEKLLAKGEVNLSEIAIRCGRVKRGPRGSISGETSWLARRIGIMPEGGHAEPTPWIHSDVLALIARGLGVSPREVEL